MGKDRFYYNENTGQYLPSGTTVLPRPDLTQWGANCAVDYIVDSREAQDFLCGDPHSVPTWNIISKHWDKARPAFLRESIEAAEYGTYIHTMCQYSLENDIELESPHEMTDKFMKGLWKWKVKYKVKVIAMEHEVITDTYGGRLDLVCEMDGVVTLVDFKTGKSSYYDTWKWQIAGYRQAYNEMVDVDADEYGWWCDDSPGNDDEEECYNRDAEYKLIHRIQTHGILKFNKKTMKVNYKSFDSYSATRTNPETKKKEKYTRTYETDRQTFNSLVANWWLVNRGIKI